MDPLPKALKDLMEARNIRDGLELSGIAEVSAATVSHYLTGKRGRVMDPRSLRTVEKLARALDVAPEYFREYRIHQLEQEMEHNPELVDAVYDLVMAEAEKLRKRAKHAGSGRQ